MCIWHPTSRWVSFLSPDICYGIKMHWFKIIIHDHWQWLIGGAERLIVDAAVELVSHGHNVHVFTAHHNRARCFEETVDGEFLSCLTIFPNVVINEWWCYLINVAQLSRYLSSYCLWGFPTPSYFLPSSCSMCISAMHFCCSLRAAQVVIIWCYTSRSGLCCDPVVET